MIYRLKDEAIKEEVQDQIKFNYRRREFSSVILVMN